MSVKKVVNKAFYEEQFDWVPKVEALFPKIREEFFKSQLIPYPDWREAHLVNNRKWTVLAFLNERGERYESMFRLFPHTAEALSLIPNVKVATYLTLGAGVRVRPHFGYFSEEYNFDPNRYFRLQLPLVVPGKKGDCSLTVNGETRFLEEGKILLFNDNYLHSAENKSSEDRHVLLIDFISEV